MASGSRGAAELADAMLDADMDRAGEPGKAVGRANWDFEGEGGMPMNPGMDDCRVIVGACIGIGVPMGVGA